MYWVKVEIMSNKSNLRINMVEELMKEVQGPRYGVNEVIAFDPGDEYLSGIIIPESWENNLEESAISPDVENVADIENSFGEDNDSDADIKFQIGKSDFRPDGKSPSPLSRKRL